MQSRGDSGLPVKAQNDSYLDDRRHNVFYIDLRITLNRATDSWEYHSPTSKSFVVSIPIF